MTSTRFALSLSLILGIGGAVSACTDPASIDNDRTAGNLGGDKTDDSDDSDDSTDDTSTAEKDAGKAPTTVKDAGKLPTTVKDAGTVTEPDPGTEPELDGGKEPDPVTTTDSGKPVDMSTPDAGTDPVDPPEPVMSVVPGSATRAKCSSYGKATAPMCAGYFCGVTLEQIEAEMPKDNICGENAVQGACDNKLPTALAKCARDVKSANALDSNEMLRPKVRDCVFKDAELKAKTPLPCMDCFLDAAICAGDNCLLECLSGDSKNCDTCRAKNKCDAKVFTCAGLISPF